MTRLESTTTAWRPIEFPRGFLAALDDKLLSRINFERLHVPRMIFAAFFATAARIDSCADAWPRLIAASLLKKIGLLPNRFPDEQCRHQMSFKFIAKISHKELDKRCDPDLYGNRAQPGTERWIRANAVTRGPVWTPLIPPTMPSDKVDHFGEQVRSAHLSRIRPAPRPS